MRSSMLERVFVIVVALMCASCLCASAEEVSFYISTVFPENQTDPDLGVYDLMMQPEQKQRLEVLVVNEGDTPLRVTIEAYGGHTTNAGMIYYSEDAPVETANPPPARFEDLVTPVMETITVEPLSQAPCALDIQMPETAYDGVVHGAVVVTQVLENDAEDLSGGMRIRNRIQYALGIRLRMTENEVEPSFTLESAVVNDENRLVLKVHNAAAVMGLPMGMTIDVVPPDSEEAVFSYDLPSFSMAANSSMEYAVPNFDGQEQIPPGEYTVNLRLTFEDNAFDLSTPLSVHEQE